MSVKQLDAPVPVQIAGASSRSISTLVGAVAIVLALMWAYVPTIVSLAGRWWREPDYSHGFLVPIFAGYLLWHRRKLLEHQSLNGSWWGLPLLISAAVMKWVSMVLVYPLVTAVSLIPCLLGVALLFGGRTALRWSWPAICYLIFMIPMPGALASLFSHPLQRVATIASTWLLQLLGIPAVAEGNVIWLTNDRIGIVEACGGLRMLMLFMAICCGASFLIVRPLWEKLLISLSSLVIGIITNILRITTTAVLHEWVNPDLANMVFHDFAGWLMMPVAMAFLYLELVFLSRLLVTPEAHRPVLVKR